MAHVPLTQAVEEGLAGETERAIGTNLMSVQTLVAGSDEKDVFKSVNDLSGSPNPDDLPGSPHLDEKDSTQVSTQQDSGILTGLKLYLCFGAFMLSVFMFALDQSIVSTAIPVIVSDFKAFDQVSWIITAYFLTQCGLILLVGQLLTVLKAKWMLLGSIFFFELGSLICALAPNMTALIVARAIQGIGASGMFVAILASIVVITRVDQRAAFMSAFGLVFVISSVIGPLLGGVFTQQVTWRLCFYINIPLGVLSAIAVIFLLPARDPELHEGEERVKPWEGIKRMDYVGTVLIFVLVICLLLALQWGGNEYAWGNWRIILLFVLGAVLAGAFAAWEVRLDKRALIPKSIFKNRTQVAACCAVFMLMMAMLGGTYQLPLYYQAGRAQSPQQSGISVIPFMLATCVGIFLSGGVTAKYGRYYPFLIIGPPFAAAGYGLLYTITASTANSKVIGYQILAGFGVGLSFQIVILSVQAEFADRPALIPQATSVVSFFQLTGAAIGVGIVNTVQSIYLNKELKTLAPNAPFELVRQSVSAIFTLPVDQQPAVIQAYVLAITKSMIPLYIAIALSLVSSAFIRNHNMLERGGMNGAAMA